MKGQNWGKSMKEVNVTAISGNKENIVTLEFYVNKKSPFASFLEFKNISNTLWSIYSKNYYTERENVPKYYIQYDAL